MKKLRVEQSMYYASRDGWWCAATTVLRLYLEIAIRHILCLKLCGLFEPVIFKKSKQYPFDYKVISFEESLKGLDVRKTMR